MLNARKDLESPRPQGHIIIQMHHLNNISVSQVNNRMSSEGSGPQAGIETKDSAKMRLYSYLDAVTSPTAMAQVTLARAKNLGMTLGLLLSHLSPFRKPDVVGFEVR